MFLKKTQVTIKDLCVAVWLEIKAMSFSLCTTLQNYMPGNSFETEAYYSKTQRQNEIHAKCLVKMYYSPATMKKKKKEKKMQRE